MNTKVLRNTLSILALFFLTTAFSQTTYYTGFDNDNEKAGWVAYKKGKTQPSGWVVTSGGVNGSDKASNVAPTGDADKDSLINWYVSPKFDFSQGGTIDSLKYNYFSFMNVFIKQQSVMVYLLQGSNDPEKATSETLLLDLTQNYTGDNSAWSDTSNISIPNTSGDAYIGLRFIAVDGWSSISFDNIYITQNKTNAQQTLNQQTIKVYPNPVKNKLHFQVDDKANAVHTVNIFDMFGKQVLKASINEDNTHDVSNLKNGTYMYQMVSETGLSSTTGKFVVNR